MYRSQTACIRRCCGLPSKTDVGRGASAITATVVGDPGSRSRAIALRYGHAKRDAVVWMSSRGGLLCSCFAGTQNALLISASSRNTNCKHTALMSQCISGAGVPLDMFRKRMRLLEGAADFGSAKQYGASVVWTVLYKAVFYLVTFTGGNVAACIAPGCRRFRGRCGHVKLARPLNSVRKMEVALAPSGLLKSSQPVKEKGAAQERTFLVSEEEDKGIENLPLDTNRSKTDSVLDFVAARVPRNMLPCAGELQDGEVLARSADWTSLYANVASRGHIGKSADLKAMGELSTLSSRLGFTRDLNIPLV